MNKSIIRHVALPVCALLGQRQLLFFFFFSNSFRTEPYVEP